MMLTGRVNIVKCLEIVVVNIPIRNMEIEDLDQETLETMTINRLLSSPLERYQVLWLEPSDFINPLASRLFSVVMEVSINVRHCAFCAIEQILRHRADYEAVRYMKVVRLGGKPYSDLQKCAMLIHDRAVIREYNSEDGERATQAWVDAVEDSLSYDAEETSEWPDSDEW